LDFDRVLVARSRRPNTLDLMLEKTRIIPDERGFIPVDDQCKTSEPKIFAVGDITPGPMLAFKATRQAKVATEVIAGLPSALDNRAMPGMVFTDPEIAWTGLTERSAAQSGARYSIAKFPLTALGEAHILGRAEGFVKVLFDPDSKLLLGAGMVGPRASEVISQITLAIELGAALEDLAVSLQLHPTMSESFMETVEVALGLPTHVFRQRSK
jgi:dihydrolipoamide dehydrogenase